MRLYYKISFCIKCYEPICIAFIGQNFYVNDPFVFHIVRLIFSLQRWKSLRELHLKLIKTVKTAIILFIVFDFKVCVTYILKTKACLKFKVNS